MRSDPAVAEAVIRSVFRDAGGDPMESYIRFLVGTIEYITPHYHDRWGITLFDWGVRLNVGWVECLVLHSGGLRILLDKDLAPGDTKFDGISYKQAIGCDMVTVPLDGLPEVLPPLTESHYAAIATVARARSPRNVRAAHSLGITEFLSQFVRRRVPNPSYVSPADQTFTGIDEEATGAVYLEGGRIKVLVNRFERDPVAREACIDHYGLRCSVCEMSFGERYGETMRDFIHVHHLVPLSTIGTRYEVDPISDLRPVCPNCHAAIHSREPALTIQETRALLALSAD
jgi:5-methylcytosine-specific restriction protein A